MVDYKDVDDLCDFMSVCEILAQEHCINNARARNLLQRAVLGVDDYIMSVMDGEPYQFTLTVPSLETLKFGDNGFKQVEEPSEMIFFPFGSFSVNVWSRLCDDTDNPLFKMLRYFYKCVRCIRQMLDFMGVDSNAVLTDDLLISCGIEDAFGIHRYEHIYLSVPDIIGFIADEEATR